MLHNLVRYSILFTSAIVALGLVVLLIKLLAHAILLVAGVVLVAYFWKKYGAKSYVNNTFKL
jgi:energy-converting hydrogenase Eha subunit A